MKCKCGGLTKILETRMSEIDGDPTKERRRVCVTCHKRFTTIEVVLEHTITDTVRVMGAGRSKLKKLDHKQVKRNAEARRVLEERRDAESD